MACPILGAVGAYPAAPPRVASASSASKAASSSTPSPLVRARPARARLAAPPRAVFDPSRTQTGYDAYGNANHAAPAAAQASAGGNVYHEPVGVPPPARQQQQQPRQPEYVPQIGATRQRFIDREAAAVQTRDYANAATAARILARLVQIEHELVAHETAEVDASLAQDYQTAAFAKRRKDALLAEFEELRDDRFDPALYADAALGAARTSPANSAVSAGSLATSGQGGGQGGQSSAGSSSQSGSAARSARSSAASLGVPVRFSVDVQPQFGEGVVVCGDAVELGAWDGHRGVPMEYQMDSKTWSATVYMPQGSGFKFKFVVVGGLSDEERADGAEPALYWQEGDDRAIQLPFDDALSLDVVVSWEGDEESEKMWLCMPVPRIKSEVAKGE